MHLMKGNIGTGIMALPSAFNYGGLWVTVIECSFFWNVMDILWH